MRTASRPLSHGFSLIELMIALLLGTILMAGIITLFLGTSKTNRVQNGMARLQENGRYAMTRLTDDLRRAGGQFRNNTVGAGFRSTSNGPVYPAVAARVNVANLAFSDGTAIAPPADWPTGTSYSLSPRYFIQGYSCEGGSCGPAVPSGAAGFPAEGTSAGDRVTGTDILTLRYQRGTGWPYTVSGTGATTKITLQPNWTDSSNCAAGPDDCLNIQTDDVILLSDCSGSTIFRVEAAGGSLTPKNLLEAAQLQPSPGTEGCDPRVFNFSRDMVSVSYWLKLVADDNVADRVISVLMRRENGVDQELVRGVERLDFVYGVQNRAGSLNYLSAKEIEAAGTANCTDVPPGLKDLEPGCLWRSLLTIEAHALFNTVDNINDLSRMETAYRYRSPDPATDPAPPAGATMPVTGLPADPMIRREFVVLAAVRNSNS